MFRKSDPDLMAVLQPSQLLKRFGFFQGRRLQLYKLLKYFSTVRVQPDMFQEAELLVPW